VKEILLSKMMQKWVLIAQHPQVYPHFPPARARKNYARLFDKYPELAEKIGLHEFSAF
jgi:hypothetical protein